ncbi:uncharacterized protein DUF4303 [Sphingomonas sp. PP-CE-3G-477]|uniref:DUF4303 domain-containing protein n=1 Tax=Sphingomonas sp. PP-CE-3G-477 TaxID=2135660 RepID=UPI000D349083|nr:DUF4303 domain-containing protein [Sphingomonas sp. PP-CE-3G-477]PTQ60108.1 uncharacterized protein DUF4303 [Sphingomonas sp. PP-CE-3G-477]
MDELQPFWWALAAVAIWLNYDHSRALIANDVLRSMVATVLLITGSVLAIMVYAGSGLSLDAWTLTAPHDQATIPGAAVADDAKPGRKANMDWDDIAEQLEQAVLSAFDDLAIAVEERCLYALALVTEDGAMGVGIAANTEEAVQERFEAELQENADFSPQDGAWLRWSVGEWEHEGWRDDLFAAVNRRLTAEIVGGRIDNIDTHLARLVEVLTTALTRLREKREMESTILFVTLTDSDEAEVIENASAQRLNPPALLDLFHARYA